MFIYKFLFIVIIHIASVIVVNGLDMNLALNIVRRNLLENIHKIWTNCSYVGQRNPSGRVPPQALRAKLRWMGVLVVMPRMLSLSALQKQSAISRSSRPKRTEQQGLIAGAPRFKLMRLRIFAQVESLSWSLGQVFSATTRGMKLRKRRLITRNIVISMVEVFAAIYNWCRFCILVFLYEICICLLFSAMEEYRCERR